MNTLQIFEQLNEIRQTMSLVTSQLDKIECSINQQTITNKELRCKPEYEEFYYYVSDEGAVRCCVWKAFQEDLFRFYSGNCFKTKQECEEYEENLLTKQALKDLALELNDGVELNWQDTNQTKYFIYYENQDCMLYSDYRSLSQSIGQVYCLNNNFISIAKDRIGEEKLIKLIKSGV